MRGAEAMFANLRPDSRPGAAGVGEGDGHGRRSAGATSRVTSPVASSRSIRPLAVDGARHRREARSETRTGECSARVSTARPGAWAGPPSVVEARRALRSGSPLLCRVEHRAPSPAPNAETPAGASRRGYSPLTCYRRRSHTPLADCVDSLGPDALTWNYAPVLDWLGRLWTAVTTCAMWDRMTQSGWPPLCDHGRPIAALRQQRESCSFHPEGALERRTGRDHTASHLAVYVCRPGRWALRTGPGENLGSLRQGHPPAPPEGYRSPCAPSSPPPA